MKESLQHILSDVTSFLLFSMSFSALYPESNIVAILVGGVNIVSSFESSFWSVVITSNPKYIVQGSGSHIQSFYKICWSVDFPPNHYWTLAEIVSFLTQQLPTLFTLKPQRFESWNSSHHHKYAFEFNNAKKLSPWQEENCRLFHNPWSLQVHLLQISSCGFLQGLFPSLKVAVVDQIDWSLWFLSFNRP